MQPRILRTGLEASAFGDVFDAAGIAGFRIGWLDLEATIEVPGYLAQASSVGALRAVAVGSDAVVTAKRLKGPPVLRDLLREHFTGCRLVLVRGAIEAPEIVVLGDVWRVRWAKGLERDFSAEELIAELRKPGFP